MKEEIKQLKKLIKKSDKILLLNHINMDWDAVWSLWAFYYILKKLWKNIKATNELELPSKYEFLWVKSIFKSGLDIKKFNPDLIICFDTASFEQLWIIYKNNESFLKENKLVVIDHHQTNKWFWKINIIDSKASSTCELTFEIIEKLKLEKYIDKKIANLLLSWIITDTNIFYNKNTTKESLKYASKLLELWGDLNKIIYNFYHQTNLNKTKLKWVVIDNLKVEQNGKIIYSTITKNDFKKTWTSREDTDWLIANLINIEWCEIAFLMYELEDWIKVSFRSKNYDVWKLASSFPPWWWHKLASWFTTQKSFEDITKEIIKKIKL